MDARISLFVLAALASGGCETVNVENYALPAIENTLEDARRQTQTPAATPAPPPSDVSRALMPPLVPTPVGPNSVGPSSGVPSSGAGGASRRVEMAPQRFDIAVKDAPAPAFFMGLVEDTSLNMVVHPEVVGTITLNLKDVTIDQVMSVVRNVYGYEFERSSFGYQVMPARLSTRIYQVNFLNMERTGISQTRVSSGQVTNGGQNTTTTASGITTTAGGSGASVTGTEISTIQPKTSFWHELEASVIAILGSEAGRTVVVNPQSGVVVVRAMPHELREVEKFLVATEAIARRQVILEAKIVEVILNDSYRQGINWAALLEVGGGSITTGQVGGGTLPVNDTSLIAGNSGDLNPEALSPILGTAASAFGGVFAVALSFSNVSAFVELLSLQGKVHVLSSPRISTMNNQKAVIRVGSDEFFVTDVSNTTTTGTTTTTTPSVELTPFFSGIALDVTPQISGDGRVMLHIHPSVSEVVDQQKVITVGTVQQSLPLALSSVRESDSIVQARSGQVVVIGGLMQDRYEDDEAGSPLSAIPGIGELFKQRRKATTKSELVILLRPVVIDIGEGWADSLDASSAQIRSIVEPAGTAPQ